MFGHSPATRPHAIRTGSWLARVALTDARGIRRYAAAFCVIAVALSLAPFGVLAARMVRPHPPSLPASHAARPHLPSSRAVPYPRLAWPLEISGSQYAPVAWADIPGSGVVPSAQVFNNPRPTLSAVPPAVVLLLEPHPTGQHL